LGLSLVNQIKSALIAAENSLDMTVLASRFSAVKMKNMWTHPSTKLVLSIATLLLWFGLQAHVQLHNHESYERCAACAAAHHFISAESPECSGAEEVLGYAAVTYAEPESFDLFSLAVTRSPPNSLIS
jgi:hypothetical protein